MDAALSLPVRIKKGKVVVMPDDDHSADLGYAALTGLSMTGDDLTGSFAEQRGAIRSLSMLRAAAAASARVLVTQEPFLGSTPRVYGGRWGTRSTLPPADGQVSAAPPGPAGRGARRTRLNPAETAAPLLIKSTSCSTSPPTGVRILTIFGAQLSFNILINRGIAFLGAVQIDEVLQDSVSTVDLDPSPLPTPHRCVRISRNHRKQFDRIATRGVVFIHSNPNTNSLKRTALSYDPKRAG